MIDRRLNGKNKSTVNRQHFLPALPVTSIKKAVEEAVSRRSITDMEHGEQISIPGRDIDEPVLPWPRRQNERVVHPGNRSSPPANISSDLKAVVAAKVQAKPAILAKAWTSLCFQITQEEIA